jgi:hypothetical protein
MSSGVEKPKSPETEDNDGDDQVFIATDDAIRPTSTSSVETPTELTAETRLVQEYLTAISVMQNVYDSADLTAENSNNVEEIKGQKIIINNEWDKTYAPTLQKMISNKASLSTGYLNMITENHNKMKIQICKTKQRLKEKIRFIHPAASEVQSIIQLETSVIDGVRICDKIITDVRACLADIRGKGGFSCQSESTNRATAMEKREQLFNVTGKLKRVLEKHDHQVQAPWLRRLEVKEYEVDQLVMQTQEPRADWKWDHGKGNFTGFDHLGGAIYDTRLCNCQTEGCLICYPPDDSYEEPAITGPGVRFDTNQRSEQHHTISLPPQQAQQQQVGQQ